MATEATGKVGYNSDIKKMTTFGIVKKDDNEPPIRTPAEYKLMKHND